VPRGVVTRYHGGMIEILEVSTPAEVDAVRTLFLEYKQAVGVDLWFGQAFQRELEDLPDPYAAPGGRLVLAREGDEIAGCGALRPLGPDGVELRRLWVRRPFRKRGVARLLVESLLEWARAAGYHTVRMEVLSVMRPAETLFRAMGFAPIPDDRRDPFPGSFPLARTL
jgi:putative acetyltransferase